MRLLRSLAALALVGLAVGCGARTLKETVWESEGVTVQLRHTQKGGEVLPRGHSHPATISDVRMAHILASLTYSTGKAGPEPVIRTRFLYDVAEGLAGALEKAGPDDIAVAWTLAHDRKLGIFSERRVTAMQAWMQGDLLYLDFYDIERRLSRDEAEDFEPPPELSSRTPGFRLQPGTARTSEGARAQAIDWRNSYFRKPLALGRDGQFGRRTVIMRDLDDEIDDEIQQQGIPVSPAVTDAQIRALDQLEGARRGGLITETEFQRRRRLILQGRLEEAGYETGGN